MKLSISTKLFIAVLISVLSVILIMGLTANWSFGRGFLGYLNEQAMQRMSPVLPRLASAYAREGNWEFLRNNRERWFEVMRPDPAQDFAIPGLATPPTSDLTGAVFRIALLDARKNLVMGFTGVHEDEFMRPVEVDGRTVGWLAVTPFQSVSEAGGERFQQYQLRASLAMGVLSLLLAVLIAWWIARTLLDPVKRVAAATHRLAAGKYSSRVAVSSNDEVGQLARDFNQLAYTLERNEKMRRDFMADVSHELRTPLSVLRGELEAIEDGVRTLDQSSMKSLQGEVSMLSKLVDDLYELSLADVGALTYRKVDCDLSELLESIAAMFEERFAKRQLEMHLELPAQRLIVHADPRRLQQLISNLLENSVRYTDVGGRVNVRATTDGDEVCVEVRDSGPGVEPEQLARLFERFYRGETSRNRASGGAGLGLAICHSIALAHGGTLNADHSPTGGLWLTLRLPGRL
ncbi:sensor histidine kinase efflux regulator BaeS [Pseudomonas cannabina]|uniref:histidine kinase n=5 Tax=Pseudomonas syringae group TaxID=136849 RepID=A0A3M3S171_PSECA|nr:MULTISPECIES: sensor histidine kinase efflux regulator BaeS [Pseudomonas syringae group]KPB71453.1 Sensor histidine kinase [Pseudomonas syringae pv. maculicola]KPW23673.1 Sensor histidine kinase [Pseudomonas cannabina pv. alisalensis]MBM0138156.1 sensor histidine kinase efflux regulator BaeS [Pseudomonas cannabina pv. alisalensis]QHE97379.1 sensor histidine kinase efflux regulator BaeS [Pseudomonas syringae pv. maculicola str. ES4326]QQN24367.1 sensor histidine kinase efflux regulator BaeS 